MIVTFGVEAMSGSDEKPLPNRHLFICTHERTENSPKGCCSSKGSLALLRSVKNSIRENSVKNVQVSRSGCLSRCEHGISCVIYPEGQWYSVSSSDQDSQALIKHLLTGEISEDLIMNIQK